HPDTVKAVDVPKKPSRVAMASSKISPILAAGAAVLFLAATAPAGAVTTEDLVPSNLPTTLSGSYLAGRSADAAHDTDAAVEYLGDALSNDPDNGQLLERLLVLKIAEGEIDGAQPLAERLIVVDSRNPVARLLVGIRLMKQGAYDKAKAEFAQA